MSARDFTTTNWTLVRAVRTSTVDRRCAALAALCEAYWYPVYAFVRRRTHDADRAADLTQAFFTHVLERHALDRVDPTIGRFRAFLLTSVKHFLLNEWERDAALKRGHGWTRLPCDVAELDHRFASPATHQCDPEHLFERHWARTVLDRAIDRLRVQQHATGRGREFAALAPFLTSDTVPERPYREVARELGTKETAVRVAVHRLRLALGRALRDEVTDTVSDAATADAELRHLLSLLTG